METKEVNLQNPIFAYYVDISGLPRQRAEEQIEKISEIFCTITNITVWIIPTGGVTGKGKTKMECIWNPSVDRTTLSTIDEMEKIASSSNDFNEFRQLIRDWKLSRLI